MRGLLLKAGGKLDETASIHSDIPLSMKKPPGPSGSGISATALRVASGTIMTYLGGITTCGVIDGFNGFSLHLAVSHAFSVPHEHEDKTPSLCFMTWTDHLS